jgi:hypothetical protein
MITQQQLFDILDYKNGQFYWKIANSNRVKVGQLAGSRMTNGYYCIRCFNKLYLTHRLVWLWHTGRFPIKHLDHIDGDQSNNKIENLRECDDAENHQNITKQRNNTSGYLGVSFNKRWNKWHAQIQINNVRPSLGMFDTAEEAHQAYLAAKKKYHKFNPVPR